MERKLDRADIVILAEAHNPSILSPQWLKDNELITEKPDQFVHTPDFSFFNSKNYHLVVDRQRLQVTTKKTTKQLLEALKNFALNYCKILPHIPYKSIGMNFTWNVEAKLDESLPVIKNSIGKITDFKKMFKEFEINNGIIINVKKEKYLHKITIESFSKNNLIFRFNNHYNVEKLNNVEIIDLINNYNMLYQESKEFVEKTTPGE